MATKARLYLSQNLNCSNDFQMVSSQELWEFREFDRSITPKHEGDQCHLEQVCHLEYVLKNGFEELSTKKYVTVSINICD